MGSCQPILVGLLTANALLCQATGTELTGTVITADALHTQRTSARLLIDDHHAHYVMIVKANQPTARRRHHCTDRL